MDQARGEALESLRCHPREVILCHHAPGGLVHAGSTLQRVLGCTDLETLDQWFDRALTVTRLSDLIGNS